MLAGALINTTTIARRELGAMFARPIATIFAVVVMVITGIVFAAQLSFPLAEGGPPPTLAAPLGWFASLFIFAAPALTMRLLAEEHQTGTIEMLLTLPVRDLEVILGKFLAALAFYVLVTSLTFVYPLILLRFGNPDVGPIVTAYLGLILWGAALLSIGVLASTVTDNQITAFALATGAILLLYLAFLPAELYAGSVNPLAATILRELSLQSHLNSFFLGLLTARDVVYYVALTALNLFAAARLLESRRWRQ
ncbi:MAG: ABC transporter permease [Candidatus Promineifilaceae bacterium]|nr:ABC transporter permease [Candidatus Promineifilaceae bacterium]